MGYQKLLALCRSVSASPLGQRVLVVADKAAQNLRANPLGPALTVCLTGLVAVFVLPQLSFWLFASPRLILVQVLLSAPLVPYAVHRIHHVSWKPLAGLWVAIYALALIRSPQPLQVITAFAFSAHLSIWILWGLLVTALAGLALREPKLVK
ncbi:MAG: hypothetical protein KF799_08740, partial [Bdellovibrionales bacterium]|nr:hypothetical protein [Bdellovibrionales bacterium]